MGLNFHILWTVTLLLVFVGIVYWAWNDRRKADFEEASRLPLDGDDEMIELKPVNVVKEGRDNG